LWRFVVCDQETSRMRRLKTSTGLWKILPKGFVTPRKQTKKNKEIVIRYYDQDPKMPNKIYRSIQILLGHYVYVILDNVRYEVSDYLLMRKTKIFQSKDVNIGANLGNVKIIGV